jgi:hypothetical protein
VEGERLERWKNGGVEGWNLEGIDGLKYGS